MVPSGWQALRRGESVRERRRELERAHEHFVGIAGTAVVPGSGDEAELREHFSRSVGLRSVVLDSWLRSQRDTIDPDQVLDQPAIADAELEELRRIHPIGRVLPVVQRLLFEEARDSGLLIAVGDAAGRLLWVDGDARLRTRAEDMGFCAGMDWSERSVGTSAPGSALAVDHAIQVLGAEHYNRAVHEWSCTAAPVHDPVHGSIIGVIDVTGGDSAASPHLLPLIEATLAALEAELRVEALRALMGRERISSDPAQPLLASPGVDLAEGAVRPRQFIASGASRTGVTRAPTIVAAQPRLVVLGRDPALLEWVGGGLPLSGRHAEILLALAGAPQGLGSAALAEHVYGHRGSDQTLRAELVRLRRCLDSSQAPLALLSRPYRLDRTLRVDAAETLEALGRGAHRLALAAYEGSVLPGSSAPIVERWRTDVTATLRESMLQSAGAETLFEYAQNWAGDDPQVWETLLQVLPPLSPKRARVVARLESIHRE